ncbi:DUF5837 family cyanobactin class RiPP [Okeania sp. SIO2B3]|uniref:DUF5837 family cyanobactin class RiPP n=1 Tax=Okeania sp. SIO2B3 TaxID=2607784 RepID=UPI0013C112FA|nr:DUF5837 family cyanobactin class RiPP [Okeania sp. SIO2B3]NET44395.1 microcyclamide/patellamide family RiPP [Okeania sp. SIO2B3]
MAKKNLMPQQKEPVIRLNVEKPIEGLEEENLTTGFASREGIAPQGARRNRPYRCSYDGDAD